LPPQQHLAQQYDPPSLPPEIMMPERRPVRRERAAPPITVTAAGTNINSTSTSTDADGARGNQPAH